MFGKHILDEGHLRDGKFNESVGYCRAEESRRIPFGGGRAVRWMKQLWAAAR